MAELQLGRADYSRRVPKEARIQTRNRYFESNPVLNTTGVALIARPGLRRYAYVGAGPIRAIYTCPGDFSEALFVVSGTVLYRVDVDGTVTEIQAGLQATGWPRMAATAPIGTTPEYLFIADGAVLYCYIENSFAINSITGAPANNDVVVIDGTGSDEGSTYYQFTTGDVTADDANANGSEEYPWLVKVGANAAASWASFGYAISATGAAGTDYSTYLTANALVQTTSTDANSAYIRANTAGAAGNGIECTVTSPDSDIAWTSPTMTGGGSPQVFQVEVPGDVGVVDVAFCSSYIVVIPAQGNTINGRFYWIEPGETSINALDYATAERAPDPVNNVAVFQDQFWLAGTSTTEVWYFTGNIDAPAERLQGVTFERGTVAGTALAVKESMIIVDNDGGVFQISGALNRISNPSIEERIRESIQQQAAMDLAGQGN